MKLPELPPETLPLRRQLANGCTLITRPTPAVEGVSVGVWVRTGSRHESPSMGGISHLLEHMVFKGTDRRSAFELARDMEAIGAQLDAFTTKEYTGYTIRVLPDQLPTSLSILAEMLEQSVYPQDQLDLEKGVIVEEILSGEDNPEDFVHDKFMDHLLPDHPLRRPILGTSESVAGIDRGHLIAHMAAAHRGGNVILAAAGAVGPAQEETLAQAFAFEPGVAGDNGYGDLPAPTPAPGRWTYPRDLAQQYIEIGIPGFSVDHPDRYAAVLLSSILGGGMSSRLFQRVREEEGLAYSVYSYADFHADTGSFCTSLSASPEKAPRALEIVADEYRKLRRGDLDDEEIENNRAQILSSMILGMEGSASQMSRLARSEMYYGRFVPVEEMVREVGLVRRDDLLRVAQSVLDPDQQTVVGLGPMAEIDFS